jgi:polysaccharide pyruvyl transferase WcaK-like protein
MRFLLPRVITGNRGDLLSRWAIMLAMKRLGLDEAAVWRLRDRDIPRGRFTHVDYGRIHNLIPTLVGLRAMLRGRIVLWTGGLDIQDDSSLLKLLHHLLLFAMYRCCGLKIILVQQGAGPITTKPGRLLARALLGLVCLAIVRDSGSERLVRGLRPTLRVLRGSDAIFLPDMSELAATSAARARAAALRDGLGDRPLIGVNIRRWFHFSSSIIPYRFARAAFDEHGREEMEGLYRAFHATIAQLREKTGARILLLSMYEPNIEPWEDDLPHLRTLAERFQYDPEVVLTESDLTLPEFYQLVAALDLMIGMRLHSCLTSLRAGVPTLHIAYTLKGVDILRDLGLDDICLTTEQVLRTPDVITEKALAILRNDAMRAKIESAVERTVKDNAALLAKVLMELA